MFVQSRLKTLEVVHETTDLNTKPFMLVQDGTYISLAGFDQLKRLTVPFGRIGRQPVKTTDNFGPSRDHEIGFSDPRTVLPKSLESVCFLISGYFRIDDVIWFRRLQQAVPNLQQMELQFTMNLNSATYDICLNRPIAQQMLAIIRGWKRSDIVLMTTFGNAKLNIGVSKDMVQATPTNPLPGQFAGTIERFLATSLEHLEQNTDLMEDLGFDQHSIIGEF
ncbi:hypothetical protein CC86DRAFT_469482 [Ophiobolus disseminans]|uniref:Uncharacterized protein n=1 Tax=Ophiobolus disseminans TaxID=1469910 RepID=A0A6A6ZRB4_9PLEO|nr:hypothetical protein CC86DRAFT_469482 [Ophiobolus disseminans]